MVVLQGVARVCFDFFSRLPIVVERKDVRVSSDTGILPIRQFDDQIGLTDRFIARLNDPRDQDQLEHTLHEMVRQRICGILAGYEDCHDHDTLRGDPVFKMVSGKKPNDGDLASQPTLSRFENGVDIPSLWRLHDFFIDDFIDSFDQPPHLLTLDIDAIDGDLAYVVNRLRQAWPDVVVYVRGDAGFGMPWMYDVCERLELPCTLGLSTNKVLKRTTENLLQQAVERFEQTGEPQRLFDRFFYRAKSWKNHRLVIAKAECNHLGTNLRFIVTNRSGAAILPETCYDNYVQRGESENRNKELKNSLAGDRFSCHRFVANYFRLMMHTAALNLLIRLRRLVADPPELAARDDPNRGDRVPVADPTLPVEALAGCERRCYQRYRRRKDPLGEGHIATWRMMLIKVAGEVTQSARRILVEIPVHWPHPDWFQRVCDAVASHRPGAQSAG